MNKNILILGLGLVIGGIIFLVLEGLLIYRFGIDNPVELSFLGLLSLLAIHALGSFFAGFVIGIFGRGKAGLLATVAALIFTSTAMITVLIDEYPTWFVLCDILIFTPFALVGSSINFWSDSHNDVNSDQELSP